MSRGGRDEPPDLIDVYEDDLHGSNAIVTAFVWWARGFLRVTELWPDAWGGALARADLAPSWAVVQAWTEPEKPEHLAIVTADRSGKTYPTLPEAVGALARALRGPQLGIPAPE